MKFGNGASRSLKRVTIEFTRIPVIRTCATGITIAESMFDTA
jgi:hypothetical protein